MAPSAFVVLAGPRDPVRLTIFIFPLSIALYTSVETAGENDSETTLVTNNELPPF